MDLRHDREEPPEAEDTRWDSEMINVTATFTVLEGRAAEFEAAVAAARPGMLADSGCLRYDLQRVSRSESSYVLLEAYDSSEAIRRHGELDAFRVFGAAIKDLLAEEPVVSILKPVGEQAELA